METKRRISRWPVAALCLALLVSTAAAAASQAQVRVGSILSSGIVKMGSSVTLRIEVEGSRAARIASVPQVEGLVIGQPGRPASEQYTSIVNGRRTSRKTLRWSLDVRPTRTGEFTIPPVRLEVDGREVVTRELPLKVVEDLEGAKLGFFEILDRPRTVYEGQPFSVELQFGWDAGLSVRSAQLLLPWWGQLPGTLEMQEEPRNLASNWIEVPVNGRKRVAAEQLSSVQRDDRDFVVLQLRRRYIATRSGALEFPTSTFEFAELVQRARSLFDSDKYREYYALLPGFEMNVRPVPEEGRPFEWSGAVGLVEASRRVDRRDVDVGDSIKLSVSWIGDANLEFFEPPDLARLDAFAGFRVLGVEDEFRALERRVTYDLVPVSPEVTEVPSVPLWVFDTELESYTEVTTDAVPIRVRALETAGGLTEERRDGMALDIRDIRTEPASADRIRRPGGAFTLGALFGVPILWLVGRTLVRGRRGDPDAPIERRRRRARRALAVDLRSSTTPRDQARALYRFLGARTREGDQTWIGRESAAVGLTEGAASELDTLLAELDERAYAGEEEACIDRARVLRAADSVLKGGL